MSTETSRFPQRHAFTYLDLEDELVLVQLERVVLFLGEELRLAHHRLHLVLGADLRQYGERDLDFLKRRLQPVPPAFKTYDTD